MHVTEQRLSARGIIRAAGMLAISLGLLCALAAAPASADVTASLVGDKLTIVGTGEDEYASVEDGSCEADGAGGCNYPVEVNPGANANPIVAGPGCTDWGNYVTCGTDVNAVAEIEADMRGGDDTFRIWPSEGWLEDYTSLAYGGEGDDFLAGRDGVDRLIGEDGRDTFEGNVGDDILEGGPGNDKFDGWTTDTTDMASGDDEIYGGADDDELHVPLYSTYDGSDYFDGGAGTDMMSYGNRTVDVALSLDGEWNDGTDSNGDGVSAVEEEQDNAVDVERAVGGHGDDFVQGGPGADILQGQAGDDVIDSRDGAGHDQVFCDVDGSDADAAYIDDGDTTHLCDAVTRPSSGAPPDGGGNPPPAGTPPPAAPPAAPAPPGPTPGATAPAGEAQVDLAVARRLAVASFLRGVTAAGDRAGTFRSTFTMQARDARKLAVIARTVRFATGTAILSGPGVTTIKPKLTAKAKRALRRMRKGRTVKVTISTTFTPLSGAKVATKDVVTLRK